MIVLDTDILIDFFRGNREAMSKIAELSKRGETITTTVMNAEELLIGFALRKPSKLREAEEYLETIGTLNYGLEESKKVVALKMQLKKKGTPIGAYDEIMAGICLTKNTPIITRNTKHFSRIKGLKTETY